MKLFLSLSLGVIALLVLAVLFVPAASSWMVSKGEMSVSVTDAQGRAWQSEMVDVAQIVAQPNGDACQAPFSGQVVVVSQPVSVSGSEQRVAVLSLTGGRRGYQVEYGGWVGTSGEISPLDVANVLTGNQQADPSWQASMVLSLRSQGEVAPAQMSNMLWRMTGEAGGSGPGVTGWSATVFSETGGFSPARVRASARGLAEVEGQVDITWQALKARPFLGITRLFC